MRVSANSLSVLAMLVLASLVSAQERRDVPMFRTYGEPATAEDTWSLHQMMREYRAAWAAQDTQRFIDLHSDDTEWINAYARMFQGSAPLGDFLENRLFPAFDAAVSQQEAANMELLSIRWLGASGAVVHLYTEGARGPSRTEEPLRRTHLHLVLEKRAEAWKIVHTAIMDAR